ncbi:PBP1A family penicillin-binding protein [Halobacillus sp. A1]|uniref:PBP1A family penicillin-binding protein n=1 Tax=Halobacillus sp. A1 TaxID=2880262 RepID=UPI0020A6A320|nr:PBP1A family penicillin-binding protein [Halobacillus sp. A1]MCP3030728.1 PBP1A family penicillin-binding protein [Halobacillus sp. A1]
MANDSQSRTARRNQLKNKGNGKKKRLPPFKTIFMTLLTIGIVLMLGIGALFAYYIAQAPALDAEKLSDPYASKIYDKDDNLITDVAGEERRTRVEYNDLPPQLVDSVLATEDVRFFDHIGIDPRRMGAALLSNVTNGFGSEGASTITQQVVKRSYLTSDKTLERKVQEQFLAIKLDQEYSKEEILEMYLNKIYYGQGAYGVLEAADTYFGKEDLNELTLAESALLAGMPQRPSAYDPSVNPDLAQQRMNTVLSLMVQHEKITEEEAEEARQVNVEDMLAEQSEDESTPYRAFIDQVEDEVEEKMGADIYNDGLDIYTTIEPDAQEYVEQMLSEDSSIDWPDEDLQTGVAVTDTESGAIRAIGGGRNYVKGNLNFAGDIKRQPGSTFKPITAYGPAIENEKLSTYHQINDEKIEIEQPDGVYSPNNYDNEFRGWVSMREALSKSLNIPAVKMLEETGTDNAEEFVEGLGFEIAGNGNLYLSDAIGGGVLTNPLEMSGAYAAFGNGGTYTEPYTVRKVESTEGGSTDLTPDSSTAMSDSTAYMITSMLETVMTDGTGTGANVSGLTEAGKTGTTNREIEDENGNVESIVPDVWFSGYTTDYSVSIWTGYGDNNKNLSNNTQQIPRQMFKSVMGHISEGKETADFSKPGSVEWVDIEDGSRPPELPSSNTPESQIVSELFHVDNQPTETSEQFEKLDSVEGLSADYNEDTEAIDLSWDHNEDDVTFDITVSTNGESARDLTTTESRSMEISQIQPGSTYEFTVVAVDNSGEAESSDPSTTSVQVPGGEEEAPEEEQEDEIEEETDEETEEGPEQEPEEETGNEEEETPPESDGDNNGGENEDSNDGDAGNDTGDEGGDTETETEEAPPEEDEDGTTEEENSEDASGDDQSYDSAEQEGESEEPSSEEQ